MLPPAEVLTNLNCGAKAVLALLFAAVVLWAGCAPPGPRALLEGKKLVDQGRYAEAIEPLQNATRLLPQNAHGWNYLGLAYHGSGQAEQAVKAYRSALAADRKLSIVRFNLGCLFLDQEQLGPAIDEFKSYTLLQPGAVEGWLKLGAAQLRAKRLDEAERSFRSALDLQGRHPEAINGLGLIQIQRRRWTEAMNQFNLAALQDPPYAPAVLNLAILNHQLDHRSTALKFYRQYLGLLPRPADADSVEATVRQLEFELNPPAIAQRPAAASATAPTVPKGLTPVAPVSPPARAASTLQAASVRTNPPAAAPAPRPSVPTNLIALKPAPEPVRPPPKTAVPTNKSAEPPVSRPIEVEVTQVQPALVVKSPQDIASTPASTSSPVQLPGESNVESAHAATNNQKRGLLARLNPFSGRSRSGEETVGTGRAAPPVDPANDTPSVTVPRYSYLSPQPPTAGSRSEAEKLFQRGVAAQKSGNRAQAVAEYQGAVKKDPAYFDAYYNLGLASLDSGDIRVSLWAYELALSLKPGSADARYNFALALKAGGYLRDAADQLQKLLGANPSDARAHLSLGNLYAQQLQQPERAREHYQRVLELNPRHTEAAKIRFWLTANP